MKIQQEKKAEVNVKMRLQVRILLRDKTGNVRDSTHDDDVYGYGLARLACESEDAVDGLRRVTELFRLLDLAAEKRHQIESSLVRRVFEELENELSRSGGLGSFVDSTHRLFQQAEALPPLDSAEMRKAGRSLALLKDAS